MDARKLAITAAFAAGGALAAPVHGALVINDMGSGLTAQALASTLLGANSNITISNAQFIGIASQGGTFSNGAPSGLGFDSGVVLSSGKVGSLSNPAPGTGADNILGRPGDPLMSAWLGALTRDAAVLKFDFVPAHDTIRMSYVFGSSEYNQWIFSEYDDALGVFVNGTNAAFVPGTATPVSIRNIHCGQAVNEAGTSGPNCSYFIDNRQPSGLTGKHLDIDLGGFTQTFSLTAAVNPLVTNTMYIAIADTVDFKNDSVVFLAGGSLTSPVPEPSTAAFIAAAFGMMLLICRRKLSAIAHF